ncbi:MAG: YbhB/YbcL family Raf kinase inhibitor-like protein [Spirochaetia bacterium]|nr:MAG: YbhB/YbcL family Raf kinase inhibitor-like protein [Spirochaetia bacterium]
MIITSPTFQHNSLIPSKYTCDGDNVNPPLEIKDVPRGTKSLALIVDDPDAPGGTWIHWIVWNIDPKTVQIPENSVPDKATEGQTSFGDLGYGGPCPPSGIHHYFFKLYTLDIILSISSQADKTALEKVMEGHILDKAELIGLYSRK